MQTNLQIKKAEAGGWEGEQGRMTEDPEKTFWGNGYMFITLW